MDAVRSRVPDVGGYGLLSVRREYAAEEFRAARERLVPADLAPALPFAHHRHADAVRIVMERAEGRPLGAHVAAAPHVVRIGPNGGDAVAGGVDREAAHGLAERAGAKVRPCLHGHGR